jgi:hypothetical protein
MKDTPMNGLDVGFPEVGVPLSPSKKRQQMISTRITAWKLDSSGKEVHYLTNAR